jgi:hypothetical protein
MQPIPTPRQVPLSEVEDFGIKLYSVWHMADTKKTVMVIERTCTVDYAHRLRLACVEDQSAADVHPADFIRWITQRRVRKVFK